MKTKESSNASETSGAKKRPPVTKENFGEYYEKHYPEIFRFCRSMLRDYDDAEDATQETFVKAYLNLAKFDENKSSFRTWLFKIATNVCIDEIRKRERWKKEPLEEAVSSGINSPDQSQDIQRIVNECLDRLDKEEKTAFVLYHGEEFTYEEIAEIMETSPSTTRNRVKSAERKMKVCLEKKGAEEYLTD